MTTPIPETENPVETMRKVMADLGQHQLIPNPTDMDLKTTHIVSMPTGRQAIDLTSMHRTALEFMAPTRRRGTARLRDLDSLCLWANRFKSSNSVLFADPTMTAPRLTCIADYHVEGPESVEPTGDPHARHCAHRGVYDFPVSDEWKAWTQHTREAMDKDALGDFIETNAKDIMDPTPAIIDGKPTATLESWETRMIDTADRIGGRFGQLVQLLQISRRFQVYEASELTVTGNRDTGEQSIQFLNEHKDAEGKPLRTPNLLIIAIPVFLNGPLYRMAVRFQYRKAGASVIFKLTPYNPEKVFEAAFDEAITKAAEETGMPVFQGTPET